MTIDKIRNAAKKYGAEVTMIEEDVIEHVVTIRLKGRTRHIVRHAIEAIEEQRPAFVEYRYQTNFDHQETSPSGKVFLAVVAMWIGFVIGYLLLYWLS